MSKRRKGEQPTMDLISQCGAQCSGFHYINCWASVAAENLVPSSTVIDSSCFPLFSLTQVLSVKGKIQNEIQLQLPLNLYSHNSTGGGKQVIRQIKIASAIEFHPRISCLNHLSKFTLFRPVHCARGAGGSDFPLLSRRPWMHRRSNGP